jgi:hypothetical protein
MFSHIIIFGSSLPEALGGQSLYAIICERVLNASQMFTIPDTGGAPTAEVYAPFTDFVGVDFTSIGAIELRVDATIAAF